MWLICPNWEQEGVAQGRVTCVLGPWLDPIWTALATQVDVPLAVSRFRNYSSWRISLFLYNTTHCLIAMETSSSCNQFCPCMDRTNGYFFSCQILLSNSSLLRSMKTRTIVWEWMSVGMVVTVGKLMFCVFSIHLWNNPPKHTGPRARVRPSSCSQKHNSQDTIPKQKPMFV